MASIVSDEDQDITPTLCNYTEWSTLPSSNCLTILCVNARSLVRNFSSFMSYLSTVNFMFDFIIVVETWLKKDRDVGYEIDGYRSHSIYRDENKRGGGIKIYHQNYIHTQIVNNFTVLNDDIESLFLEVSTPSLKKSYIGGLYRPPDSNTSIPPKLFLVGGTIEQLLISSPNSFLKDLKL